jgi:hypothetical protein
MQIDKQNGNIAFNEENHRYWNVSDENKKFISVTTLIEKFGQPFDKDFWSAYKALETLIPADSWKIEKKSLLASKKFDKQILGVYDISETAFNAAQQSILDAWAEENRKSCERGTKIHSELENSFYKAGKNVELKKFGIGGKFECKRNYTELDLPYGVYPEYLISRTSDDGILNIAGQIDCLVKNGNEIVIIDHKGLPLDTSILTSNGWSTMGDLKVGDKVFDKDGNLCNVTVKSAVHNNPCCKIKFDNAESIVADVDHRWLVSFKLRTSTKRNPDGYKHQVMTTMELKTYLDSLEKRTTSNIPKILNAKPLNNSKTKLPLDPYVLGAWLGDGSKDCGIITQAKDSALWNEIQSRGYELGENLNHDPERANVEMRTIYGIRGILNYLGVLGNKHIPDIYLLASYEDRLDLLRGLMDTDGYFHPTRKRFVMTTSFDWQMKGMKQLVSSLGCKVSVFKEIHKCEGKEFPGWNINFTTNKFNPFLIRNAEIKDISLKDNNSFRNIESIEFVDTVPTQCIAVDSPSHTYLCTDSLIVTHNTNKKIDLKGGFNTVSKQSYKMLYPLNNLEECNYNHYQLQLSTYAWMLQKINPNFIIKDLILNHYDHEGNNTLYHCDYLKDEVERMLAFYKKSLIKEIQRDKRKPIEY